MTEFMLEMDHLSGRTWEAFTVRLIIRLYIRTENNELSLQSIKLSAWSVSLDKDELIFWTHKSICHPHSNIHRSYFLY